MKINFPKNYKGFDLISENYVPDCKATGIYLRHRTTGLEVFHLVNDDPENLFAFAFRTPVKDSTGAAHIMEHSVFCGSEKFPLKEPFTNMMNQSVNTFLNAMTYSDKTVYPASSMVKSDYFNLLDVYADAVFFPLLKKEAFLQEAHRLEMDENGDFSIQGVVYNEMKGNYSSFDSVAAEIQIRSLFPGSNYAFDSGGDPAEIPTFTYEAFKEFHKKYYSPEKCLLFLCGNIPTEEQLDFLEEKLISRLEKKYPKASDYSSYPHVPEEFSRMEASEKIDGPCRIKKTAPSSGATGSLSVATWNCGDTVDLESYMECAFLAEILVGNDGSPLTKALVDSNLGDELAPISGISNETKNFTISFGLSGVKQKNEEKVFDVIMDALKKIHKNGIGKKDLEAAVMSAEVSNRETERHGGPFSLTLLDRTLNAWNYGKEPYRGLLYRSTFEKIRLRAEEDSSYVQKLIEKYILNNKQCVFLSVEPSSSYFKEREKSEKEMTAFLSAKIERDTLKKELDALHAYQQYHENEDDVRCIPDLDINELDTASPKCGTELLFIKNGNQEIPFFKNIQNTNGLAYLEVGFPVDALKPKDYKFLSIFSYFSTNCGWNGKNWAECSLEAGCRTGGIGTRILSQEMPATENSKAIFNRYRKYNFCGRDWIFFSVRLLCEKAKEGLELFAECISGYEFTDKKRMKNLLGEIKSAVKSSVVPHGNRYASTRVQCAKTHSGAVDEIIKGFSQYFFVKKLSKRKIGFLSKEFSRIKNILSSSGSILSLTADEDTAEKIESMLPLFSKNAGLRPLVEFTGFDNDAFMRELIVPGKKELSPYEIFQVSSQVGFVSTAIDSAFFGTKESVAELLLSHWLSGNLLWERIRTTGGAYGAYAASANLSGHFLFQTFRDPSPFKSIQTYRACIKDASEALISEEECKRSITGTYGDEIQPLSPFAKGRVDLTRMLYCISDEDRFQKLKEIKALTPDMMKECASRIHENSFGMRTIVVCSAAEIRKRAENAGNIIKLRL